MATWKITPLCLGYITRPKKNFFEDYTGTEIEPFPVNSFYLTDGVHKVVIDNGGCSPEVEGMPRGVAGKPYSRTENQVIDKALANIGVDINDIEAILFTHLHWDHAFNTHLFPKGTRLICQKRELESLDDPDEPSNKIGYVRDYLNQFEYELIDGDAEIFPGVSVVYTPGHTIGCQSIVVDTEDGVVIVTGDLIPLQCSWYNDPPKGNGLCYNDLSRENMHKSMEKLRKISTKILTGHDNGVFGPGMGMK